jgi:hypothetical protein
MKFRRWLAQSEAQTLRKIAAAQCQFYQAKALERALTAEKGDASDLLMRDEIREAAQWNDFVRILDLLSTKPEGEHFQIAKLQTPTNYANTTEDSRNAGD